MAVTNGWGQAAVNNTIDYGKGKTTATNDWGKIYDSSASGDTSLGTAAAFANTKSILLDGVDDSVIMGNVLNMADDGSDAFTISFWCKGIGGTSIRGYVGKLTSALDGYGIYRSGNIIFMLLGDYPSNALMANYTFSGATDGNYHHIVWSYDGSQDVSGFTLYIDGVAVSISTNFNNTPSNVITTEPFAIGSRGGTKFNNSNFDEVAYFNTELSASDVTSIYNSGVPNDISSLSPVSWWRCGDGDTAPTLTDNGSGGNNGTMTNFSTFSTDVPT